MDDWAGFGSEAAFEEYIRELLLLANSPEALGLTEEPLPKSPEFLKWERKLLADPFGYARKVLRPMWRKVLTTVACLMLAVTVAFGGLMAASPTARAWVSRIVTEWYENNIKFIFQGKRVGNMEGQELGYLPSGFEKISEDDSNEGIREIIYQDSMDRMIIFNYQQIGDNVRFGVDNEHTDYEDVEISGQEAHLLRASSCERPNYLVWISADGNIMYMLISTVDPTELIAIAESVE